MNVRMMPPQGPMGQPMPMGGAPAPMPPQGGPMPVPPMQGQPTAGQQKQQGLGSTFGGSASGRQGFKQFMAAKKQTSAMVPQIPQAQMPMPQAPMGAQPMLPAPSPQMMGAMKPMGAPQMGGPVQAGRPMRGTQGGLGSAPVQLNKGGAVEVPRETNIYNQPHMLAYIRPEEADLLRGLGGMGTPGPGGVPQFGFWESVKSFFSGGGGGSSSNNSSSSSSSSSNNDNNNSSVPVYDNYYDAIDAEGVGATVNIGGKIVKAETADGYTGSGSNTNTSTAKDYSFMDADEEEDYNLGTGTDYSTAYDPFSNDDDDDPVVTTTPTYTDTSTISGISAASGVDYDSGVSDPDPVATSSYYEPPGFDFDGDGEYGEGSDVVDPGDDDPFVDLPDYSDDNVTPIYDGSDSGYGGDSDETDFTQPVYTPPVDTTPSPPPPPPKYYDMFGGEHSSQAAADAADAQYEAQAVAAEAVEFVSQPVTDGGYTQADIDASNNTAKLMNDYSAISDDYSNFQGFDLSRESGNTIGYATGGSKAGYAATINAATGQIEILTPGSQEIDRVFEATELEDALNYLTDGDVNLTNLDAPLDLLPEASGGTGTVGLDAEGRVIEYGVDDIEEMLEALEGVSDMTDEELAEIAGEIPSAEVQIRDPEEDLNLFPKDTFPTGPFREPEETGLEAMEQELATDFMEDMTPFEKSEIESLVEDYYATGAGQDGYNIEDEIADELDVPAYMDALSDQESDLNALDLIAQELDTGDDTTILPDEEDDIVFGGEDDQQQQLPEGSTSASQLYLNAAGKQYQDLTEAEQRALYGLRGQTPNAAEAAYLQSLLRSVKHAEDGPIDTRKKIPASGITTYGSYIDEDGNFVASDEITGGTGVDAKGDPIMIDNPNYGKPMYEEGDSVAEQRLGETFEDLLVKALDIFVNPLSILGDKFTLEGQQAAYIQEQLDAYRNGGTFVYGEDGKTVVGVAKPNYDADGDGENDTVVLNNENNDFSSGDDDIIVSSDGISISDVEINDNVDGEDEDDDIEIVFSDTTFENTEDGVVEESVGGTDTTTTGGDDPCPDGYSLVDGMCQPDDGIGTEEGDEAAARVNLRLRKIDRGGGDIPDVTIPDPVEGEALIVRKPAQFEFGGGVYGPDADQGDYDRYYVRDNVVYTDYGPGVSTYQIGEGEDPSAIINFLDQQGFRETAPADSMDDGSAFLGFGGDQTSQGQQGQTSLPVFNPVMPEPKDPTIPDYETPVDPDPIADPIHDPRKMIIRAPKQFDTAYDGIVFNPDTDPLKRFMDNSKAVPFSGQKVRKTAQFAQGGMVTPNIDRFLQSLGS